jgi:hypothetical protein
MSLKRITANSGDVSSVEQRLDVVDICQEDKVMKHVEYLLIIVLLTFIPTVGHAQVPGSNIDVNHRDGAWWRVLDSPAAPPDVKAQIRGMKVRYVMGLMDAARRFELLIGTHWIGLQGGDAGIATFADVWDTTGTADDLVDGLDTFYIDPRNRNIEVANAIEVVIRQLRGETKAKIDQWTSMLRELAAAETNRK